MGSEWETLLRSTSLILGWTYFLCWSISFYPQPIINYRRRSTRGLSVDFPIANLTGFSSYTVYTGLLLFSPRIRSEYVSRHPHGETSVRLNDFVFALHGTLLVVIVFSQFWPLLWGFRVEKYQRPSRVMLALCTVCIGYILATVLFVMCTTSQNRREAVERWGWLDVAYAFGTVKLLATTCKYVPQVWVNFKRKATLGFSIEAILLDFTGGVLSIVQLLLDSSVQKDWSAVTGNPAKFVLGNISIFFDFIFISQHYYLYRQKNILEELQEGREHEPLLHNEGSHSS